VACLFGDGAVNRGPFLEGLNWAALFSLPVLFVCEDNGVAAFTPAGSVTAGPGPLARAQAIGVFGASLDGNEVVAVDAAVATAVAAVRRGEGPRFIHVRTYRLMGHTSTDAAAWRPTGEVAAARGREPMARLAGLLAERGVAADALAKIRDEAKAEMDAARMAARAAPWPNASAAFEDVQNDGAVAWSR